MGLVAARVGAWVFGAAMIGLVAGCASPAYSGRGPAAVPAAAHDEHAGMPAKDALLKLAEGNARFVAGRPIHPDQSIERREEVAKAQHPFAIVLCCSDSRVPPEIVFDAGVGDLFVVRVAGNTADEAAIGSIEYAVEHLGASLVVVLGHQRCGAVQAAVDAATSGAPAHGHLPAVIDPIAPAVAKVMGSGGNVVDNAVRENVARVVRQLKACKPVLAERVESGKLTIVGGYYGLDTGAVELK
jgi:carbonic anhydrase